MRVPLASWRIVLCWSNNCWLPWTSIFYMQPMLSMMLDYLHFFVARCSHLAHLQSKHFKASNDMNNIANVTIGPFRNINWTMSSSPISSLLIISLNQVNDKLLLALELITWMEFPSTVLDLSTWTSLCSYTCRLDGHKWSPKSECLGYLVEHLW